MGVRELGRARARRAITSARAKYGDQVIDVPISMHRELTRRQMEEHPPDGPDPANPLEREGRLRLGLADICECIADLLRLAWREA